MDRTDKERFFIVGSAFMEVVTPLFRERLDNAYTGKGFASLEDFVNDQPIKHTLYHLRHSGLCCLDNQICRRKQSRPLNNHQWDLLFTDNLGQCLNDCFCKYTAKPVRVEDFDVTMCSVILLNCCSLCPVEKHAVRSLRQYKNDYMSHNTKGKVDRGEYMNLWANLKGFILQLDPSKEDDLKRLENRPLDESLCNKYNTSLLDLHQKIDEVESKMCIVTCAMQEILNNVNNCQCNTRKPETAEKATQHIEHITIPSGQGKEITNPTNQISPVSHSIRTEDTNTESNENEKPTRNGSENENNTSETEKVNGNSTEGDAQKGKNISDETGEKYLPPEDISTTVERMAGKEEELNEVDPSAENSDKESMKPYRLGQDIFTRCHQYKLTSLHVSGGVMMGDGRLVFSLYDQKRLLICNTDGSEGDSIPLQSEPYNVTAVNNFTVAVILPGTQCIEMFIINNKHKSKSIPLPEGCQGITTINKKLVVGCWGGRLLMIDDQTGEVEHTVNTDCVLPSRFHTSGDRIFYCDSNIDNHNLNCYSYTDDKVTTLTLPSHPWSITSLQDGSLYVVCKDGSIQHVSSDVQHYIQVNTKELASLKYCHLVSYNGTQRKLFTCNTYGGNVKIFEHI